MSFGTTLIVERCAPVEGQPDQLTLGRITADHLRGLMPGIMQDQHLARIAEYRETQVTALLERSYCSNEQIIWGIHTAEEDEVVGLAMLGKGERALDMDLETYIDPEHRGKGYAGLALAGLVHAAFTPAYANNQNPRVCDRQTPLELTAPARRASVGYKNLLKSFGFVYTRARRPVPGIGIADYVLKNGQLDGHSPAHKINRATQQGYERLREFTVTSKVGSYERILPAPEHMLRPLWAPHQP